MTKASEKKTNITLSIDFKANNRKYCRDILTFLEGFLDSFQGGSNDSDLVLLGEQAWVSFNAVQFKSSFHFLLNCNSCERLLVSAPGSPLAL